MNPLEVYKKLPRTNCGKCPPAACMPFAVQFTGKMVSSSQCPELDADTRKELDSMLPDSGDWKEKRMKQLLNEISGMDFFSIAERAGAEYEKDCLKIDYMGGKVGLDRSGFDREYDIMDRLLVLMYIKQSGQALLSGKWVAFRDLKDGLIRSESFHGACEIPLAAMFGRNKDGVINKLSAMGAEKVTGFSADHSFVIYVLPRIPFLVLFWSGDEDFGPECKILFDSTVTEFIDVEALLYLGMALVRALRPGTS